MLRTSRRVTGGSLLVGDAQNLPFVDDSVDVGLAMHMLYHVPDRARALAELRRVVRGDGLVLVVTNSVAHLGELDDLIAECADATIGGGFVRPRGSLVDYTLENGARELEAVFEHVTLHPFSSELVIDRVEPVIAYARSLRTFVIDSDIDREPVLLELARRVKATIDDVGAFRVHTATGCFVCR
jgi:ubiquinone/menaquinone biosynthesis C-methylase UbiE